MITKYRYYVNVIEDGMERAFKHVTEMTLEEYRVDLEKEYRDRTYLYIKLEETWEDDDEEINKDCDGFDACD